MAYSKCHLTKSSLRENEMNTLELLLSKRMIVRDVHPQLYYKVKDELKMIRNIMKEKFGYIVILTPQLIKLEKIPSVPEIWMGINEFQSIVEYQMFLQVLTFLEDKEVEEQFVLSHLADFIMHQSEDMTIDWTVFTTRRQLIRVIQYCLKHHLLIQTDGDESDFAREITTEVLYENTGISRYMMRNFARNIMEFTDHEDFKQSDWIDIDTDRGVARRHRVYRNLLLSPGMYEYEQEEDFHYLKNYRNQIQLDFQSYFECDLHVHKSSAYLVLSESSRLGQSFPENNAYADLTLITHSKLMDGLKNNKYKIEQDEIINLESDKLRDIILEIAEESLEFLPKTTRELGSEGIAQKTLEYMIQIGFVQKDKAGLMILPIVGKVKGAYEKRIEDE